jgi:hypothetical protein
MAFVLSMIFAFVLVAMTTVFMTIFAMLLMRWMLGLGQALDRMGRVHTPSESFRADEVPASRAIS